MLLVSEEETIRYKEIAFVAYPVTDVIRARKFYEGVLGLKPNAPLTTRSNFLPGGCHCSVISTRNNKLIGGVAIGVRLRKAINHENKVPQFRLHCLRIAFVD